MTKLRCAVVGVGYLGNFHADKYKVMPEAELVAVCDVDSVRVAEMAAKHQVPAETDYRQLLGKVDAVSIAVPTSLHHEVGKFFLEHGVHVLLEKPITTTEAEAKELVAIAKQNNLVLQVGHLERLNPVLVALKDVLQQPLFIESMRIAPFKLRGTDVNVILDLMIHDIDIVQYLVGSPIKNIHASGAPVLSKQADIANARLEFENGCVANITASRISLKPKRLLRIFQQNAYISGDLDNKTLSVHRKGENEMFHGVPEIVREDLALTGSDALKDEVVAFLQAIINKEPAVVSGEDGLRALVTAIKITSIVQNNLQRLVANEMLVQDEGY